jgi:polyhydroxyalkanoate synthesis repressor PhaR
MKSSTVVIKKHGGRRQYDSTGSCYVNLLDIAALIREGKDVEVVDAESGQDLTRVTLTQIITGDAKEKPTGLPLELLRQLIMASDEVRQEFSMWYLKSAFDTDQKVQEAVQSRLAEVQSAILSPVDMTIWTGASMEMWVWGEAVDAVAFAGAGAARAIGSIKQPKPELANRRLRPCLNRSDPAGTVCTGKP